MKWNRFGCAGLVWFGCFNIAGMLAETPTIDGWAGESLVPWTGCQSEVLKQPPGMTLLGATSQQGRALGWRVLDDDTIRWAPGEAQIPAGEPLILEWAQAEPQWGNGRIALLVTGDATRTAKRNATQEGDGSGWTWAYEASRPGRYQVWVTYERIGPTVISPITIQAGQELLTFEPLSPTSETGLIQAQHVGVVVLTKPGETPITLANPDPKTFSEGVRVIGLTLKPTSEGRPPIQQATGRIVLHSRDATVQGTKLQYEKRLIKNTLGYWVNVSDQALWDFHVHTPGRFRVKVFQGCGTGQGGSRVDFVLGDQRKEMVVLDTGHFQNFVPRDLGEMVINTPGQHRFQVIPKEKAKGAIMDIRYILLDPIP